MKIVYFKFIKDAVSVFHKSDKMHHLVGQDVGKICLNIFSSKVNTSSLFQETYFEENTRLKPFLTRLRNANKQLFLITNSAFWYVDRGMTYLLGSNWQEFFDIVICQARKPSFFGARKRYL